MCGETGIRTLGPPKRVNGFRDRPDRPLRHLSFLLGFAPKSVCKNTLFLRLFRKKKFFFSNKLIPNKIKKWHHSIKTHKCTICHEQFNNFTVIVFSAYYRNSQKKSYLCNPISTKKNKCRN